MGLLFSVTALAQPKTTPQTPVKILLANVRSYSETQQVQVKLRSIDGIGKISLDTESPGLVVLQSVVFGADPKVPVSKLLAAFSEKYSVTSKVLPSGTIEVRIAGK